MHPNPTDGATTVTYFATDSAHVRLDIYDPQGRLVTHLIDGLQPAGAHAVFWDGQTEAGQRVAAGTYFARLEMGGVTESRRILIVR